MSAYQRLLADTQTEREAMLAIPLLQRAQRGEVSHAEYLAFLGQAYHHVRYTVPLMMACGARLPADKGWLRDALVEYIDEEHGHEHWFWMTFAPRAAIPMPWWPPLRRRRPG